MPTSCRQRCSMVAWDTVKKLPLNAIESKHVTFLWPCTNSQNRASCCHSKCCICAESVDKERTMTIISNSIWRKWCSLKTKLKLVLVILWSRASLVPHRQNNWDWHKRTEYFSCSNSLQLSSEEFTERIVSTSLTSPFCSRLCRFTAPSSPEFLRGLRPLQWRYSGTLLPEIQTRGT